MLVRGDQVKKLFNLKSVPKEYTVLRNFKVKEGTEKKKLDIYIQPESKYITGRFAPYKVWAESPAGN